MPQEQLTITLTDEGKLSIAGSINNKLLAYGLLEAAKDAIRLHHEQQQNRIQPVTLMPKLPGS
jgi:hypothetical protein